MTQFEKLQQRINTATAALPYALNEEQNERLQNELQAIQEYRRAEMLNAVAEIVNEFRDKQKYPTLDSNEGYSVSYVCWLLGVSDFNPLEHPWLLTEKFAIDTFRECNSIKLFYTQEINVESVLTRLYGSKVDIRGEVSYVSAEASEDGQDFEVYSLCDIRPIMYQVEEAIRSNVDPAFNSLDIPLNDEAAFKLLNSFDWMGVFYDSTVDMKFVEAMHRIQPTSFSEFVNTRALIDTGLQDIIMYAYNKEHCITEYFGIPAVDNILRQSNGVLLYTRQKEELENLMKKLSPEEISIVKSIIADRFIENECVVYTDAYEIFRLAYMKAHYPKIFLQVRIVNEEYCENE